MEIIEGKFGNGTVTGYESKKLQLPAGKITVRYRQMRGVWQVFCGNAYVTGASDEMPASAISQLVAQYEVKDGSIAHVCGLKEPAKIIIKNNQ
jgi:hypothetical protein